MNYYEFIEFCKTKPEPIEDFQWHHITPKCLGGLNTQDNRIKLSFEDHWKAHQLLAEMYPESKELQRVAKKSLDDFLKVAKSQQGNKTGKKGRAERTETYRYNLSINHKSRYDDGSLSMEEKIERYNRLRKMEKEIEARRELKNKYKKEYKEYIEFNRQKAKECYKEKEELSERIKTLIEEKQKYNMLSRITFEEWILQRTSFKD